MRLVLFSNNASTPRKQGTESGSEGDQAAERSDLNHRGKLEGTLRIIVIVRKEQS